MKGKVLLKRNNSTKSLRKWRFAVDTGGTFTDIIGLDPHGKLHTLKILSDSTEYEDACIEGIRRMLGSGNDEPLPENEIETVRIGTTVATNALLERKGGRVALFITGGFSDLLDIGYQNRPDIFRLCIKKPSPLYEIVFEVEERIDSEGRVLARLNKERLKKDIVKLKHNKIDAVSVVLMHSWKNPAHEILCRNIFAENGIENIFLSHKTMNSIKIVSRGRSTVADAYLGPVIAHYIERIMKWTGNIRVEFMQSSGLLTMGNAFTGKNALFSGPAGGVVAVGRISKDTGIKSAIGFDMGGTSTDVSRYDGVFERVYEKVVEGIEFQTETLNVVTVASGGGSILWFDGRKMKVGPESAGAIPGPACYGFGGPLTVTDANLVTGRILPEYFPRTFGKDRKSTVDINIVRKKFQDIAGEIHKSSKVAVSPEDAALGFLRIANERMAMAIKEISVSKGYDVRNYALVCFGGAGGQHACEVASILGINKIIFHPFSSLLSAYGIGLSQKADRASLTVLRHYDRKTHAELEDIFANLKQKILKDRKDEYSTYSVRKEIDLRPAGTEAFLTVPYGTYNDTVGLFRTGYKQLFGFFPESVKLEVVNLRVEISDRSKFLPRHRQSIIKRKMKSGPVSTQKIFHRDGFRNVPVYIRDSLAASDRIKGPACIVDENSTLIIDPGFIAEMDRNGIIIIEKFSQQMSKQKVSKQRDPVLLEVFNNLFMGIATEMGHALRNTAYSVNMKERLDFSCAIFDGKGNLVANAPHIPVHLGSMVDTVKSIIEDTKGDVKPGDVYLSNNPYKGGSHLPDLTVVCPVFSEKGEIIFFTASRGHHADIGGISPGSIPPYAENVNQEGIIIDSFLLLRDGVFREKEILRTLTEHPYPVRNLSERISDLKAQMASCQKGVKELKGLVSRYGISTVLGYMQYIQENAGFSVRQSLQNFLKRKSIFKSFFEDYLDDGSKIKVNIVITGGSHPPETLHALIDFTGTCLQHSKDNLNAPLSVTRSALFYVFRSLTGTDIPLNSGCLDAVDIVVPEGSLLNPSYPMPVAAGNVETSQRVVDVLLGALKIAAASQGTMNNLLFQVEGDFPYYETIAGGSGAMHGCPGASGVQVHMTNTRITDPEILEFRHPDIRLMKFKLRKGSGGKGLFHGGDGVIREIKFLKPATVTIISERRNYGPYGMNGGGNGKKGADFLRKADGRTIKLPHRIELRVDAGDSIVIETPGGGGFGKKK